jgi:hypothetical protein
MQEVYGTDQILMEEMLVMFLVSVAVFGICFLLKVIKDFKGSRVSKACKGLKENLLTLQI